MHFRGQQGHDFLKVVGIRFAEVGGFSDAALHINAATQRKGQAAWGRGWRGKKLLDFRLQGGKRRGRGLGRFTGGYGNGNIPQGKVRQSPFQRQVAENLRRIHVQLRVPL